MAKCGDCLHFPTCSHYVTPEETFPEVGGCSAFKNKGDFVEVVRCKDCTKISPSVTPIKDAVWCREFRAYMPCDGFCSYGERREGE